MTSGYNPREDDEIYLGTRLLDRIESTVGTVWQGLQDASRDQEGIGDDILRLMGGGVMNVATAISYIPGVSQLGELEEWLVDRSRDLSSELTPDLDPRFAGWGTRIASGLLADKGIGKALKGAKYLAKPPLVYAMSKAGPAGNVPGAVKSVRRLEDAMSNASDLRKRLDGLVDDELLGEIAEHADDIIPHPSMGIEVIQAQVTKPRTSQQIEDALNFVNEAKYSAPLDIFGNPIPELLPEMKQKIERLQIVKEFSGDTTFVKELSDYLNLAHLWRKMGKSNNPSQPMKGFPLGNTVIDPKGNAWILSSEGAKKGYTLKLKDTLDDIAKVRASARRIPVNEVTDYIVDKLASEGLDTVRATKYAQDYIRFNRIGKRALVKIIKDTNTKAGKVVLSLDHLVPVSAFEGTIGGADMYHNLMMLDKVLNSKLGNIKNPQLNLALGAVSNIYADIDIWLDKFGPNATGQLWGFFRDLTDLQKQQIFERAILKGENVQDILEQMKFGEGVFQGSLF